MGLRERTAGQNALERKEDIVRRRTSEIEISMFPFLSVLCAVIGILMLMIIVIIGTRVIQAQPAQGSAGDGKDQHKDAGQPGFDERQRGDFQLRIQELEGRLDRRRAEYQQIALMHARLQELLETKELEGLLSNRRLGTSLDKKDLVHVVPDTRVKFDLKPICIEVRAATFVVHPEKRPYALEQLEESDSPLQQYLKTVFRKRDSEYLVFLVRPGGVRAFDAMRTYLNKTYRDAIHKGLEPIPDDWEITQPE